jgi:threonine dehydratase
MACNRPLTLLFSCSHTQDVSTAMYRIRNGIYRTSCKRSHFMSRLCGAEVFVKHEFTQFTGSFKERGARNALMLLTEEERQNGVIAASAGNHALALAWHGANMGIPVTVVMPTIAPLTKVSKCKDFGANVVQHGMHILEAKDHALSAPEFEGMKYINGYDDPEIVAGAGTMGIEILEQVPDVDVIVVPVGGGGLIAGTALAVKTLRPEVKVYGVEPEFCPSYTAALKAGKPVSTPTTPTLADGLAVPVVGGNAFEVARHFVDDTFLVSEKAVALAVLRLLEMEKFVVEGGGAAGLAAILPGGPLDSPLIKGKKVVVPLCGGNIDVPVLGRVIDRGLAADNRLARFVCPVSDRPGGIANLTRVVSDAGGSIRDIYHERAWLTTHMDQVQIKCVVEMWGLEHQHIIDKSLKEAGLKPIWGDSVSLAW